MIEFALNSARSETTGFSPFFLNYGHMPCPIIWDVKTGYPGVCKFAQMMKDTIMVAHDAVIAQQVKQTKQANNRRKPAPFALGDLVYVSTKNISIPKQRARKLVPKYIGPYPITHVLEPGSSYKLDLPPELKQRGINPSFHTALLKLHIPNNDRRFPGRLMAQVLGFNEEVSEWAVDRILSHSGKGHNALFELLWKSGDTTWEECHVIKDLEALEVYCEALGVTVPSSLPAGKGNPPDRPL
jgi:hypothetical protein